MSLKAARRLLQLGQLLAGLALFGISIGLMLRAQLGLGPWDVLHQGIARRTGIEIGWVVICVSILVLLAWITLRQRPGPGTLLNALLVGLFVNASLRFLPSARGLAWQSAFLATAILMNGIATGLYIGAGLGPGPRDGLMTGLAGLGYPIWAVRGMLEGLVLAAGFVLGGKVGVGTALYAVAIGPLAHFFIPKLGFAGKATRSVEAA